ncbi:MAG: hypothetical protein RBS55_07200 [Bacteroidales bacterium]|jgi:hypothetical protein|nr:hypothetical protein [Bacteroidales bacterium]
MKSLIAIALIAWAFSPMAQTAPQPGKKLHLSGANRMSFRWMDSTSPYASSKAFFIRDEFNVHIDMKGVPINAGFLLTSENESFRQCMNQFYLRFSADEWLGAMTRQTSDSIKKYGTAAEKIFRKIHKLEIGTFYPDYSRISFSGLPVSGVNIAIMPGPLFLAFSYGTLNRATENTPVYQIPYQRRMLFASLGAGKPRQSHLFFNFTHTFDKDANVQPDTFSFVRPADTVVFGGDTIIHTLNEYRMTASRKENFIAGTDLQLSLLKRKIILGGELSVSMLTPDQGALKAEIKGAPEWAVNYFDPRLGSHIDYSYLLRSDLNIKTTNLSASYLRVMPGYEALTNPFLRRNSKELNVLLGQSFFKRKLFFRLSYKNRNEEERGCLQNFSFSATLHSGKWPSVMVGIFPSKLNAETYDYSNTLYQLSVNYPWKMKASKQNTSAYISYQAGKYSTAEEIRPVQYWNFSVTHRFDLSKSTTAAIFTSFSMNEASKNRRVIYTLGANVRGSLFKKIKGSIGTSFVHRDPDDITLRTTISANYDAGRIGLFSIKGQYAYYHFEDAGLAHEPSFLVDFSYTVRF